MLLRNLIKLVYKDPKQWADFILLVLKAYRTSKCTSTQATPFSLVYAVEAIVLVGIMIPPTCLALTRKVTETQDRVHDVKTLEEKRQKAQNKWLTYQRRINKTYNKLVKLRVLKVDDLVLEVAGHV